MTNDIDTWSDALQTALSGDGPLKRVVVLRETNSTQDAARRMAAVSGDVVVAGRQTQGRGRRGRIWADTGADGIATTFVLSADASERRMLAAAVATARAVESLVQADGPEIGIKWPNDIMAFDRKLAGVLVEQSDQRTYVGVGLNVAQQSWSPELEGIAISLAQSGANVMRLDALRALFREMEAMIHAPEELLISEFAKRDVLRGRPTAFRTGGTIITGTVRDIDPLKGLLIEAETGELWLPARTTSVVKP